MAVEAPPLRGASAVRPLLRLVDVKGEEADRIPTGVAELDRVLGGGLVPASLVLVGGEPGVGKSTLLLSALGSMSAGGRALLVTGEESVVQVKLRAARLGGCDSVEILAETELEAVCAALERERPAVCVIDSVQTLYSSEIGSAPGSVSQVREAAARILRVAKEAGVAVFLVGHVTKDGSVAGPRVLEHLVDCVLQFEGDRYHAHRVLRATKNRFGSTNELAVFEMTATGLVGVPDPSELFGRSEPGEVGSAVTCVLEGTRPLLIEIQSLVAPTDLAMPRRVGTGVDPKRLAMIVAVLARHAGVPLRSCRRVRERRGRGADRRARGRSRDRARDRVGGPRRAGRGRDRRVRRARAHGPAAPGDAGAATPRGVSQAGAREGARPGRHRRGESRGRVAAGSARRGPREHRGLTGFSTGTFFSIRMQGFSKTPAKMLLSSGFLLDLTLFAGCPRDRRRFHDTGEGVSLYKVGDKVVYPHHGAGTIVKREQQMVLGETREYLTIKILHSDMTVNVPLDNAERVGLRKVIDEEAVKKVVKYLTSGGTEMPKNWNRRFKHNRDKMKTGDIFELAEVVRNLSLRDGEKGLSTGEKQMYVKAKKILASELMYAKNLSEDDAVTWLEGVLTESTSPKPAAATAAKRPAAKPTAEGARRGVGAT